MRLPSRFIAVLLAVVICSQLSVATPAKPQGPAIPITPGDEPWVVTKLRITDCRAVRGFVGAPVDGSLKSAQWDGKVWEYPTRDAGAGVGYDYLHNDGLHITFADDDGFNAVLIRGGVKAKLYHDVSKYDDRNAGRFICDFPGGGATTSRAWFDQPIKTGHISFFDVSEGKIADCSFFRVRRGLGDLASVKPVIVEQSTDAQPIVLSQQVTDETGLAAMGVDFQLDAPRDGQTNFTISIVDPLDPRLELHGADYAVTGGGRVRVVCDFPDQVVPAGTKVTATLSFDRRAKVRDVKLEQYRVPKEQAIAEALEYRKFILHALYTPISEARPWNIWNNPGDDKKYFDAGKTGNDLQDRLRPYVREMVMTLNQCLALDPEGKWDPLESTCRHASLSIL